MINGWIMSGDTAVASFRGRVVTPILPERCPLCFQKVLKAKAFFLIRTSSHDKGVTMTFKIFATFRQNILR